MFLTSRSYQGHLKVKSEYWKKWLATHPLFWYIIIYHFYHNFSIINKCPLFLVMCMCNIDKDNCHVNDSYFCHSIKLSVNAAMRSIDTSIPPEWGMGCCIGQYTSSWIWLNLTCNKWSKPGLFVESFLTH